LSEEKLLILTFGYP